MTEQAATPKKGLPRVDQQDASTKTAPKLEKPLLPGNAAKAGTLVQFARLSQFRREGKCLTDTWHAHVQDAVTATMAR